MLAREKLKTVTNEELNDLINGCEEFSNRGIIDNANVRRLIHNEATNYTGRYDDLVHYIINSIYREGTSRWQRSLIPTNTMKTWHEHVIPSNIQENSNEV